MNLTRARVEYEMANMAWYFARSRLDLMRRANLTRRAKRIIRKALSLARLLGMKSYLGREKKGAGKSWFPGEEQHNEKNAREDGNQVEDEPAGEVLFPDASVILDDLAGDVFELNVELEEHVHHEQGVHEAVDEVQPPSLEVRRRVVVPGEGHLVLGRRVSAGSEGSEEKERRRRTGVTKAVKMRAMKHTASQYWRNLFSGSIGHLRTLGLYSGACLVPGSRVPNAIAGFFAGAAVSPSISLLGVLFPSLDELVSSGGGMLTPWFSEGLLLVLGSGEG